MITHSLLDQPIIITAAPVISRDCQHDLPHWSFSLGKLAKGETVTILKPAARSASHIKSLALLNSEARQKSDREMDACAVSSLS